MVSSTVYGGKYRVVRELGRGGMGVVFEAVHLQLGSRVALKRMSPEAVTRENTARFLREARAAATLNSPHIAKVIDIGTTPAGVPWLVMEFLEGEDLGVALGRRGPFPIPEAVRIVTEVCGAMTVAHAAGIIHRDLKPGNLMLAKIGDGTVVKVLDFGIAKDSRGSDEALTASIAVFGTIHYMSPEQLRRSTEVTPRSDIWSIGVILYQLLTGIQPFRQPSVSAIVSHILSSAPPDIRFARPDIPAELAAIVARCLEKSPEARYADASTLARELAPFLTEGAVMPAPQPLAPPAVVDPGTEEIRATARTASAWAGGALLAVAMFCVGVAAGAVSRPRPVSAASSGRVASSTPTERSPVETPAPATAESAPPLRAPASSVQRTTESPARRGSPGGQRVPPATSPPRASVPAASGAKDPLEGRF